MDLLPLIAFAIGLATLSQAVAQTSPRWSRSGMQGVAALSGFVRDVAGVPQSGALIQILAQDSSLIASAITDGRGQYRLRDLLPGNYRVRATQALYLPSEREKLKLTGGTRTVVDLTLSTIFSPSQWLPAQRRGAEEPGDDWMWTLRSSVNRPILRWVDDGKGKSSPVSYSSSGSDQARKMRAANRVTVTSDDSSFGHGGVHQSLTMERVHTDGISSVLRADLSGARTPYPVAPSADVAVGFERGTPLGGYQRTLFTYHSHPELVGRGSSNGLQASTLRSAQHIELGDLVMIDAGSMLREINMAGNAVSMLPFLHVAVRSADHIELNYGYATSMELQSLDDLDRVEVELPVAIAMDGHLKTQRGSHQTLSLSGKAGRSVMEIAVYRDNMTAANLSGTGVLTPTEIAAGGVVADPTTQSFRALSGTYRSLGYRVLLRESLTKSLSITGEYETGSALVAKAKPDASVQAVLASLTAEKSYAATFALSGRLRKSGTRLRASYRWQPENTLTAVDGYHSYGDAAYFGLHLRQPLHVTGIFPRGLEAVVDITNLLAQGYQPFVSSDGRTLYFAQSPKVMQAGVSFSF